MATGQPIPTSDYVAVTAKYDWEYSLGASFLPSHYSFPEEFLVDGKIKLKTGEEGFRVQTRGDWSRCQFQRRGRVLTIVVPSGYLRVGKPQSQFRMIERPVTITTNIGVLPGFHPAELFIRHFWIRVRGSLDQARRLGMLESRIRALFHPDHFQNNVDRIISAILPEVYQALSSTNSQQILQDLLECPRVTDNWPANAITYLRPYTMVGDHGQLIQPAGYAGKTMEPQRRDYDHLENTLDSQSHHYVIARKYPESRRFTVPIMGIDGFDSHLTAMAEETVIALFSLYAKWHFVDRSAPDNFTGESLKARYLNTIGLAARNASGWPLMPWEHCNVAVPIFHHDDTGRSWVRQSIPATPSSPELWRYSTSCLFPKPLPDKNGRILHALIYLTGALPLAVPGAVVNETGLRKGQLTNVVFYVSKDGSRLAKPWVNVPDVGLYDNFAEASSLEIHLETHDGNQWHDTQYFSRQVCGKKIKGEYVPYGYCKAMQILQLLKGIVYTTGDENFDRPSYSVGSMQELKYNHLEQTLEWVELSYPLERKPHPKRMTYEENVDRMLGRYSSLLCYTTQPPDSAWLNSENSTSRTPRSRCDWCLFRQMMGWGKYSDPCQRDGTTCDYCKTMFNRPCTWTPTDTIHDWSESFRKSLFYVAGYRDPGEASRALTLRCEISPPFGGDQLMNALAEAPNNIVEVGPGAQGTIDQAVD